MRNKFSLVLVMVFLLSLLPSYTLAGPLVRIGIFNGKDSVAVGGQRAFSLVDATDGSIIARGQHNEKLRIEYRDGQLYINNRLQKTPFFVRLDPGEESEFLTVEGRRYRGELEIRPSVTKKGLTVIEILPLEEYLYGVIPWEISPAWPVEAVKAQAVAARTYALYNAGKHAKDGFDLCNTTECQVYGGREAEDPRGNWGVDATRGMVATYKNKLIPTYFHSSSGGYTENIENVWSGKNDYIRAVPDFDQHSPYFHWELTLSKDEIGKRLAGAGYKIGSLQGIKLSPLKSGVNEAVDRGVSGRVKTIVFLGSEQNVILTGNDARRLFQLNSTLFDVELSEPGKDNKAAQTLVPDNKQTTVNLTKPAKESPAQTPRGTEKKKKRKQRPATTANTEQGPAFVAGSAISSAAAAKRDSTQNQASSLTPGVHVLSQDSPNAVIIFAGHGSGHGLGLSQWGAKAMAEQGPKDDRTYYQQILKHYYQGVDITKWY
ncbi:MAG TPA: SpoIID/LytB domain-containing protein [Negativicutes bacterium]|nr:SpoIID/LytB domain-containing protein [Negativicutes bacterium]